MISPATHRGYLFLKRLHELAPGIELTVFSFREENSEPPFLDDIRALALDQGAQFFEARQVGKDRWLPFWRANSPDLIFAVSWRYLIPPAVYRMARFGAYVFHDSLLPKYRGFSPTVWAIINGEDHTGVTLFEMTEAVDAGDIVDQQKVSIGPDETIAEVMNRVTQTYLQLLEHNLPALMNGSTLRRPQDHTQATYGSKRLPDDNRIDWVWPAKRIHNLIRAVTAPYSGSYTSVEGKRLKVWSSQLVSSELCDPGAGPGRVVGVQPGNGSLVLAGDGMTLLLRSVQLENDAAITADHLLTSPGQTLGR